MGWPVTMEKERIDLNILNWENPHYKSANDSQYVESDLNKKSCSGLKTTTASKGIQYMFKITLNLNPKK